MHPRAGVEIRILHWLAVLALAGPGSLSLAADPIDPAGLAGLKEITAEQLITAVLAGNPTLPATQSAWEAAAAQVEPAGALDDPTLSFGVAPETLADPAIDDGFNVQLSQRLPWPGKRGLRRKAAAHEADAARQGIQATRLDLVAATKDAFADWYLVHVTLRINAVNQALWREFRTIAQFNYAAGRGSKQDILQADVEYTMLEHRRIILERQRTEIRARLNRLMDRAPEAPLPPPADLPEPTALPELADLRTAALEGRSERRALQARIEAGQARAELAQREFYPDFQVTTGYNSLWEAPERRWSAGVTINIPLDRSKRRAAASSARAQVMETRWRLEDLEAAILAAVEQAYAQVEESRHVLTLYRQRLLPLAQESLDTAMLGYRDGVEDILTLISTERNLFQTRLNYEQARADYYRNLARLERITVGWDALKARPQAEAKP